MVIQNEMEDNKVIELANASIYQRDRLILEGVNLTIRRGEFVYLLGKTGTGKSTLLKTLYGDLPLRAGIGRVVGFDLKQLNWKSVPFLRRKLGMIFQDFHLLMDRNVEENLRFALEVTGWKDKMEISKRINLVLENVRMAHKAKSMPYTLSGGEQQRIAIARALLNDPELILADEPTGNLDPETSAEIFSILHLICTETETAAFIASHDIYTISKFPGRIIRCGNLRLEDTSGVDL
ncbi:MAG: ATP-binding cassette domain-containing protein [Chitinophagales bacterium]